MKVCFFTHRGKVRTNNEDALLIVDTVYAQVDFVRVRCGLFEGGGLFCVADGLGGHEGGEVASRLVVETLAQLKPSNEEELLRALEEASKRLRKVAEERPELSSMGCTLAGVIVEKESLIVFNVGDCRVYRVIDKRSVRLSRDHSVVEGLVQRGLITEEEARFHPYRHVVTSAIMAFEPFEVFTRQVEPLQKDRIVICSDGLWEETEELWMLFEDPDKFVSELFKSYTLPDNLSFIALEIG